MKKFSAILLLCSLFARDGFAASVLQIGKNFTAAIYNTDSAALPPDASLAVSSNHIVEFINGRYSVFSKANLAKLLTKTDLSFWTSANISFPAGWGVSDPRIVFDSSSQRWFASMIDLDASELDNRFLLAVSASDDPTGVWRGVAFMADPVNGDFADFPTLGIDANGVYLAGDMSDPSSNTGATLISIPKIDLLANPPSISRRTSFPLLNYAFYGEILQPVVNLNVSSTSETVLAVSDLGYDEEPHSSLIASSIQNAGSSTAGLSAGASITIPQYSIPFNPAQPGANGNIDDGDARFSATVYRVGNFVYATHSTQVGLRAAIQWFKINASSFSVIDSGIISDPVLDLFYPSIIANTNETMVIAFNASSSTNPISSYAVLGEPINGIMNFGGFVLLKAGTSGYRTNSTSTRWGDYSALAPDPADPSRFWALTMYPSSSIAWSTQITELIAAPVVLSISNLSSNVSISWPAAASAYHLQTSTNFSASWSAVAQTPVTNNNHLLLVLGITNSAQFFRLIK